MAFEGLEDLAGLESVEVDVVVAGAYDQLRAVEVETEGGDWAAAKARDFLDQLFLCVFPDLYTTFRVCRDQQKRGTSKTEYRGIVTHVDVRCEGREC